MKSAPFRPRREIINIPKEIPMVLGGNLGAKVGISPKITDFTENQGVYKIPPVFTKFNDFAIFQLQCPKIPLNGAYITVVFRPWREITPFYLNLPKF